MVRERAEFIVRSARKVRKGKPISQKFSAVAAEGLEELNVTVSVSDNNDATVVVVLDAWIGSKRIWLTRDGLDGTDKGAIGYIVGSMAEVGAHNPYYMPVMQKVER